MLHKFTVVIIKEKNWYVARSLELGVTSQGKTVKAAEKNLKEAIELYLENEPELEKRLPKTKPVITTLELNHV